MGIVLRLMSIENLSSLPMAKILQRISVPLIGALFQAYPVAIPVGIKILVVPHSSAAIVTLLFKNDENTQQRAHYGSV